MLAGLVLALSCQVQAVKQDMETHRHLGGPLQSAATRFLGRNAVAAGEANWLSSSNFSPAL